MKLRCGAFLFHCIDCFTGNRSGVNTAIQRCISFRPVIQVTFGFPMFIGVKNWGRKELMFVVRRSYCFFLTTVTDGVPDAAPEVTTGGAHVSKKDEGIVI